MDEKYKAILDCHRQLLIKNIILTDEFYDLLQKERVLPDAMITDVKAGFNQEERNSRLLSTLMLRTSLAFRRFRAVLLKSGHHFLADLLWEEDYDHCALDESMLLKFPNIFDKLTDDVKRKFGFCIDSKVREKALQLAWRTTSSDRVAILQGRSSAFQHEKALRGTIDEQDKQLILIKNEMCSKEERIRLLTIDIQSTQREMNMMKNGHKKELEKQSSFNSANNSAIMRLKERFVAFNDIIINLNQTVRTFLGDEVDSYNSDSDNIKISYLERNLKRIIQSAKSAQMSADTLEHQKQEIVKLLSNTNRRQSIVDMVKDYLDKEQNSKISLWREIEKLADAVRGLTNTGILQKGVSNDSMATDMRYLKNYIATLQAEVQHLHKRMAWKDGNIRDLASELESYKHQLPKLKVSKTPPPSPDSNYEMNVVYDNMNDYIEFNNTNYNCREISNNIKSEFGLETFQDIPVTSPRFYVKKKMGRRVVFSDFERDSSKCSPINSSKTLNSTILNDSATLPPV